MNQQEQSGALQSPAGQCSNPTCQATFSSPVQHCLTCGALLKDALISGRFRIEALLGRGGMGAVYRATDLALERAVALKVLAPSAGLAGDAPQELRARFFREARVAAQLDHPNIVPVLHFDIDGPLAYLVMPLLTGGTLAKRMRPRQPCDPVTVASWLHQIAAALDFGHHRPQPIVHRDVKPSNLLFHEDGRLCLADFGIARVAAGGTESGEAAQLTRTGMVLGSLSYMAPEQINGHAVPASDQYSTGVLLYEALTGVLPFEAADNYGLIIQQVSATPTSPSEHVPTLPGGVDAVVLRALAKQPEERYPTVSALAEAFEAALTSAPTAQIARPHQRATLPIASPPAFQVEDDLSKSEPLPGDLRGERPTEAVTILRHSAAWAPAGMPPQAPSAAPSRRNWIMPGIFIGLMVIMLCVVGLAGWGLLNHDNNTQASATATAGVSPTPTQSDATRYTNLLSAIELTTPVFQDALHRGTQNRAWIVTSPGTFTNDGLRLPTRTIIKRGADVTVHATIAKSFSLSDVEVDVSITNSSVIYGLGFFPIGEAGHALYLNGDGEYAAMVADASGSNQTIQWASNPALALTPNQTAHFEVIIQANQFVIFLDKQFITTAPFSPDFSSSNFFALFSAIQNDKPSATVTFSNLKVFSVSGATTDA